MKHVTFDERGNTVTVGDAEAPQEVLEQVEEVPEAPEQTENESTEETPEETAAPVPQAHGKYRIGDKTFASQDEALAYASSHVSTLEREQEIADAYRQGIRDAVPGTPETQNVTPVPADDGLTEEQIYADLPGSLKKIAERTRQETLAEIRATQAAEAQGNQVWNEFTAEHPELADMRAEAEAYADRNKSTVQAIVQTKGRKAAYNYMAMQMKKEFERYANAVRPRRVLPNTSATAAPTRGTGIVTPKAGPQKALSFADQVKQRKVK